MFFKVSLVVVLVLAVVANPTANQNRKWKEPTNQEKRLEEAGGFFEGDMRFPEGRNVITDQTKRWSNGIMYYDISNHFSEHEKGIIIGAMNAIQATSCVRFERRNYGNFVYITREDSGCWSYLGMLGGRQDLNLQGNGCVYHGIALHELLHALGFVHQHQADDRDNYIIPQLHNVESSYRYAFDRCSSQIFDFGLGYDYDSVMHYGPYAFSMNGQMTIITRDPHYQNIIGQRGGLSNRDIIKLNIMYGC